MSSLERIQKALNSLLYLPHLQAQHSDEQRLPVAGPPGGGPAAAATGRPWDRGDLFRRLATFRSSTWFCKPAAINPVECARRGWTNTATDLLSCEFCKAKVSCPIPTDLLPQQAQQAGERYTTKLSTAHDAACPWRSGSSSLSLLQFPPLTTEAVCRDFEARCGALWRLACLPPIAAEAYNTLAAASSKRRLDQLLLQGPPGCSATTAAAAAAAAAAPEDAGASVSEGTAALGTPQFEARARLLALCGWDLKFMTAAAPPSPPHPLPGAGAEAGASGSSGQQHMEQQQQQKQQQELPSLVGPESAALLCSLCNAKAGLWTFFPQCKPLVLAVPRRRGGTTAQVPTAAISKAAVRRNVAADMGTTIAGGTMRAPAGSAAPFGAVTPQSGVFGLGASAQGAASAANGAAAAAPAGAKHQAPAPAATAPFGSSSHGSGGMPVFGFAALQASSPPAGGAASPRQAGAEVGALKRKQPDFSWKAVMADIDAKAAAQKRSKAAAAAGNTAAAAAAAAAAVAAARGATAPPEVQHQIAAAAAIAGRYRGEAVAPLDPLALHRPFCPWVNCTQAGEKEGRCGWRWCLQQLVAPPAAGAGAEDLPTAMDSGEEDSVGGGGGGKPWDPAKLLRNVLHQVDVHK